ncbi:DPP IV N-terminal domain-containing protein [Desertivirga brevis]|uniref:DPP IV N-terminal domain-containing protein n=1 Tax=Desertivirga brevis TaxID=2810310 RepID=UPI001A97CC13|nr:basic secretory protein-like protein [Pedobacter sp. SYSU D00873]
MKKASSRYKSWLVKSIFLSLFILISGTASAQYFGQNLVRYKNLKFKVKQSPHFELYHYLRNDSLVNRFMQESEVWYDLHQQVFRDTFAKRNPVILYENHPDFQSTTVLQGGASVGTGGVTEGMKNRVVMPIQMLNHQTRHVLGHELVHAFQYHTLIENDSTNLENIGNLPLWMVEGMAEYLSVGKVDAFTGMWMRDAYLNRDIPTLRDLTTNSRYFPYRYGQAFWTYIGSTYGDTVIVPLFKATARFGYEMAIRRTFGYDERTLSSLWRTAIENQYKPMLKDTAQVPVGRNIINNKNAGDMNVAPAISPDGKYIAFLSEKELLSIDLYLADAQTGKIIRRLTSRANNSHIDEFSFIESAGAWSPDSRRFAFSAFSSGRNKLFVIDVKSGKTISENAMGEVGEFSNLSWSPDGSSIAFTGLKDGQSDIYVFNLTTKQLNQLTNDKYSDYQPAFSPDGKTIVFSTDRTTFENATKSVDITYSLALIDLATKAITNINVFAGANNLNPQFSGNSQQIYFLSNRDGFRNMYRYTINGGQVEQLTNYFTGISGITEYSPALSVSLNDDIVYSYYRYQKYTIYNAKATDFKPVVVNPQELNFDAAILPPTRSSGVDIINANLENFERFETIDPNNLNPTKYRPQFKLDYLASNGVGASVGRFGTGMSSGVQGVFSDILGRNQIYALASVNGEIYDAGGQVAYINQKSRINWGTAVSHIPYLSGFNVGYITAGNPNPDVNGSFIYGYDILRTFEDQVQVFAFYPFSRTFRFEAGTGVARYSYRIDRYATYYDADTATGSIGRAYRSDRAKLPKDEAKNYYGIDFKSFSIYQLNAAFVGDNALFGITSPLSGFRYRLGADAMFGDYKLTSVTADFRKYIRTKKVTFAGRAYSYSRMGRDEDRLYPLFIGYPYLIRGYEANSFYNNESSSGSAFTLDQLVGSKIAVGNLEARIPFTGPKKLTAIESRFLFSDLNFFFDIGLAYDRDSKVAFRSTPRAIGTKESNQVGGGGTIIGNPIPGQPSPINSGTTIYERIPAMSAGVSLRVNVFGYFVLEPYLAYPFQRKDTKGPVFGLAFAPGW